MAIWSFLANIFSKVLVLAVMLLSIRWTLPYLGAERFGIWMTVASFSIMLVCLDFGIGNALVTRVATIAAEDNHEELRGTISGSLGFLFVISVTIGLFLFAAAYFLPIEQLLKTKDNSLLPEIKQTLLVFAALFGFNIFGSGVQKLFSGLQRSFESALSSVVCSILALGAIFWASHHLADIPQLLLTTLGLQTLSGFLLFGLLIKRNLFSFINIKLKIKQEYKMLYKSGFAFLILQIGFMIGWAADSLIISSTLGVAAVTMYSIAQRLFQVSVLGLHMINGPLWGAYADAKARDDKDFIRKALSRSMKLTFILSLLSVAFLLIFNKFIIDIWLSSKIVIPISFLIAFACWTFIESMNGTFGIFLNGMNIIRPQVFCVVLFAAISLILKLTLINEYGIIVIPLSTAIAYVISTVLFYRFIYIKDIKLSVH
jgi:O-antigen/teichoic acid export membrane protein